MTTNEQCETPSTKAPAMSTTTSTSITKRSAPITIANVENGVGQEKTLSAVKNGDAGSACVCASNTDATDGGPTTTTTAAGGGVQLPQSILDKLFQSYSVKQNRGGLKWFILAAVLFNVFVIVVPPNQGVTTKIISMVFLYIYVVFYIVLVKGSKLIGPNTSGLRKKFFKILINATPHAIWRLAVLHMVCFSLFQSEVQARDILGWALLLQFLIFVGLPVQVFQTGIYIALTSIIFYVASMRSAIPPSYMYYEQLAANIVLVCCASAIGLLYYYMGKAKQKRAFLEAMQSLEVKMIIEEESAEQERLLLSVLPKHVAVKMRQDLGSTSSEPFKKIYMSRHENVSILYADIVGFTAISSTYSAQDLVKMLNELFARFDRLSEKYQQLRIKILGDCYYCISGAPDERPDHAVLCVHMGLSMVKAIKYVQQKTNSPVDMRVGIHTGAVLAGILGQRQWQFDVYSKDVELANKMESSGKAGRVHISDKTLAFLSGEFEVEPAYGEKREEALRIAGLKTYFIVKVLKPFSSPGAKKTSNETTENNDNDPEALDDELLPDTTSNDDDREDPKEEASSNGQQQNGHQQNLEQRNGHTCGPPDSEKNDKQNEFKKRLQEELVAKDEHQNLSKDTNILLRFKNHKLETAYAAYREPYSSIPLLAALLVQLVDICYSFIVLPKSALHFVNISAPLIPITMLVLISIAESFPGFFPSFFVNISKRFNDITFVRELAAIIIALIIGLSNIVDMYFFVTYLKMTNIVTVADVQSNSTDSMLEAGPVSLFEVPENGLTVMPSYFSNFGVLILLAIAVIAQLTHMTKIVLMVGIALCHCYCNIFLLRDLYNFEDLLKSDDYIPTYIYTSAMLILAALALSFIARHMDHEDRVIFKWKTEVADQKEMATDMRERNEALVYNVLPVHVAEHFMKNTKRSHDDLYSQSYSEVGVLFASMPNFSDFYSEETVNNQGLECLRFLNEVISDFDALLELPQFQDIIKIKTIGSTYMAASGINLNRISHPDDPITKRWSHLDVLVEFALELQKALKGINEQSFNHFVLKMGINHGPITAGVIGARKPHYDIWGNTVNVASRMESTGKAGAIQVTEETCTILQEFGYTFLQRGLVSVKGKGELMTYYLQGKSDGVQQSLKVTTEPTLRPDPSPAPSKRLVDASIASSAITHDDNDVKTPLLIAKTSNGQLPDEEPTPTKTAQTSSEQVALIN